MSNIIGVLNIVKLCLAFEKLYQTISGWVDSKAGLCIAHNGDLSYFRRRQPESNQLPSSQTEPEPEPSSESQKSGRKLGRQVSASPNQEIKTLVHN